MNSIKEFLSTKVDRGPIDDGKGEFSDWLHFTDFKLTGKALQFVESRVLGIRGENEYECVEIPANTADFLIQCKGVRYGDDTRIAAMRTIPPGIEIKRGNKIGTIPIDFGGVAVVDIDVIAPQSQKDEDDWIEWLEDIHFSDEADGPLRIFYQKETGSKIPCVDAGFGDGTYDVFELLSNGAVVGLEVEFIRQE